MKKEKSGTLKKIRKSIPLYIMMIPGLLYLIINNYMPLAGLIRRSPIIE